MQHFFDNDENIMDDLHSLLMGRLDRAFSEYKSAGSILHRAVYEPLDGLISSVSSQVACTRGCDICCHRMVICTRIEAIAVMEYLQGIESWTRPLHDAIRQHSTALQKFLEPKKDNKATWIEQRIACPFLSDGECMVYPMRPVSCRTYHSLDDPSLCLEPLRNVQQVEEINQAQELFYMMVTVAGKRIDPLFGSSGLFTTILEELLNDDVMTGEDA